MNRAFFLPILTLCLSFFCRSQEDIRNQFLSVYNDSIDIFLLGEVHFEKNLKHQLAIIEVLNTSNKLYIGLESPFSLSPFFNDYLKNENLDSVEFLSFLGPYERKKIMPLLQLLRENRKKSEYEISIFCFDNEKEFYKTKNILLAFFKSDTIVQKTNLFSILKSADENRDDYYLKNIIGSLLHEFETNISYYARLFGEKFDYVETVLRGMKIGQNLEIEWTDENFIDREEFIKSNLDKQIKKDCKTLIITGNTHVTILPEDPFYDYKLNSFGSYLFNKYPGEVYSIFTQYIKRRKLLPFLGEYELTEGNPRKLFKKRNSRYLFLDKEELAKHPSAYKRCSILLVYDCRKIRW